MAALPKSSLRKQNLFKFKRYELQDSEPKKSIENNMIVITNSITHEKHRIANKKILKYDGTLTERTKRNMSEL